MPKVTSHNKNDAIARTIRFASYPASQAEKNLSSFCSAYHIAEQKQYWEQFLTSLDRISNKLKAGLSKEHPTVQRLIRNRKEDALLNYLEQARNTLEHGVTGEVSNNGMAEIRARFPNSENYVSVFFDRKEEGKSPVILKSAQVQLGVSATSMPNQEFAQFEVQGAGGATSFEIGRDVRSGEFAVARSWSSVPNTTFGTTTFHPQRLALTPVTNRSVKYEVPRNHLGAPIPEITPQVIGRLGLDYYLAVIDSLNN